MFFKKIIAYAFLVFVVLLAAESVSAETSTNLLGGGQIDFTFTPVELYPPIDPVNVYFQPDGKIVSIGRYENGLTGQQNRLYRFLPNAQRDTSFNTPTIYKYDVCALQNDGKFVCSYRFLDSQGYESFRLIRLNSDGSLDNSFNYAALTEGEARSIVILSNGQILVAGLIIEKTENPVSLSIARINSNGEIDHSFGAAFLGRINEIAVQPDGKILALTGFPNNLLRFNPDGTIDPSFTQSHSYSRFALLPNGKILVSANEIARLNSDGTVDATFRSQQTLRPFTSFAVQSDGKILLNANLSVLFATISRFERLDENGALIQRFTSYFAAGRIHLSPTGGIFISGVMYIDRKTRSFAKIHDKLTQTNRRAFDLDGDGKADFAVYRPSEGVWYILNSGTNTFGFTPFGAAGDKPVPADYDGDMKADIAVFRPSNGTWYRLRSSNGLFEATQFGLPDDIPTQYDYDGDGKDDISVFRSSGGIWYRLNSLDGSFAAYQFGSAGDKPQPGDYDGDGKADFAVYRPSNGVCYRLLSIDNSFKSTEIGFYEGALGTPADYDGDGRTDLFHYKNFSGDWYGLRSGNGSGFYLEWGNPGDIPVPADYDGDSKDDIAVWRPSTGTWWVINSTNGSFYGLQLGAAGDIPVQSTFVR